jgi:hypothetical protein
LLGLSFDEGKKQMTRYSNTSGLFIAGGMFALCFGFMLSSPQAVAQDSAADDEAPEARPVVAETEISGRNMSPREKQDFAQQSVQALEDTTNRVLRLIEEAQKKKDVVLLNCLNDKLGALRGLLKVAGDSKLNLAEAAARENLDLQEHNFRKLFIAKQQALTVTSEADACVGQVGIVTAGQTRVVVSVAGGDPGADTGQGPSPGGSSRPPDTSPFQ